MSTKTVIRTVIYLTLLGVFLYGVITYIIYNNQADRNIERSQELHRQMMEREQRRHEEILRRVR